MKIEKSDWLKYSWHTKTKKCTISWGMTVQSWGLGISAGKSFASIDLGPFYLGFEW